MPFFKHVAYPLGTIGFIVLTFFVIVGTSNAVNLTDGLDGLAIMPTVMVGSALGIFAYVAGHAVFSKYLGLPYIPGAGELAVICGALAGAGLGFLWFNAYPAEVFMGDVGALALGAALGTIAVIIRQEIVLFIMGGVFVVETLSVMIQVAVLQVDRRQAHLPHGAAASPLRARGLEGKPGRGALLDHHHDAGALRPFHPQAQMMREPAFQLLPRPAPTPLAGRRVLILGLGDTGLSVARWVEREGGKVRVADSRREPPRKKDFAGELHVGAFSPALLDGVDAVCVSPGLSLEEEIVRKALAQGLPVFGDIELFAWHAARETVLAITGTNGKSTVTALAGHLLRSAGMDCEVAGNIAPAGASGLRETACLGKSAARLGARAVQLPARDHLVPGATRRRDAQPHRGPLRPLREP